MRKNIVLFFMLFSILLFAGCSESADRIFYGTYRFKEVTYLSPLSSSMVSAMEDRMAGTEVTIEEDLFKILSKEFLVELASPTYKKMDEISDEVLFEMKPDFPLDRIIGVYAVEESSGEKTNWRIYHTDDRLWFGEILSAPTGAGDIVMTLFELEK